MSVTEGYDLLQGYLKKGVFDLDTHEQALSFVQSEREDYKRRRALTPGLDYAFLKLEEMRISYLKQVMEEAVGSNDSDILLRVSSTLRRVFPVRGRPRSSFSSWEDFEEYWSRRIGSARWQLIVGATLNTGG